MNKVENVFQIDNEAAGSIVDLIFVLNRYENWRYDRTSNEGLNYHAKNIFKWPKVWPQTADEIVNVYFKNLIN